MTPLPDIYWPIASDTADLIPAANWRQPNKQRSPSCLLRRCQATQLVNKSLAMAINSRDDDPIAASLISVRPCSTLDWQRFVSQETG